MSYGLRALHHAPGFSRFRHILHNLHRSAALVMHCGLDSLVLSGQEQDDQPFDLQTPLKSCKEPAFVDGRNTRKFTGYHQISDKGKTRAGSRRGGSSKL